MAYTTNKLLSVMAAGANAGTWGTGAADSLNEGVFEPLDKMLGGTTSKSLTNVNVALTASEVQNGMLRLTGTLTGNVTISPDTGVTMVGFYFFENVTTGSYTVTLSNSVTSVALPQSRRGIVWIDNTTGPRILAIVGSGYADPIEKSTSMLFYQAAAPTGWTINATSFDHAVKLSTSGGSTSGSVNYSALFARTATDSHTLTTAQIPSHTHDVKYNTTSDTSTSGGGFRTTTIASTGASTATAAGTATGGGDGHTHNIDMRVRTATVLVAVKG